MASSAQIEKEMEEKFEVSFDEDALLAQTVSVSHWSLVFLPFSVGNEISSLLIHAAQHYRM